MLSFDAWSKIYSAILDQIILINDLDQKVLLAHIVKPLHELNQLIFDFNFQEEWTPTNSQTTITKIVELSKSLYEIDIIAATADLNLKLALMRLYAQATLLNNLLIFDPQLTLERFKTEIFQKTNPMFAKLHIPFDIKNKNVEEIQLKVLAYEIPFQEVLTALITHNDVHLLQKILTLPPFDCLKMKRSSIESDASADTLAHADTLIKTIIIPYALLSDEMFDYCVSQEMSLVEYPLASRKILTRPDLIKFCLQRGDTLAQKLQFKSEIDDFIPEGKTMSMPHMLATEFLSIQLKNILSEVNKVRKAAKLPESKFCDLAHFAATCAGRTAIALLISNGLDLKVRDENGLTPLHYAAAYGNHDALILMILAGADIHALDDQGRSALHWAVIPSTIEKSFLRECISQSHLDCAKVLLNKGANPDLQDDQGKTPNDYQPDLTESNDWVIKFRYNFVNPWDQLFEDHQQFQAGNLKNNIAPADNTALPFLKQIAIGTLLTVKKFTENLNYRHSLPEELSIAIEEEACKMT